MQYEGQDFKDPFFEQIARYPVRFAHPVFLGESPHLSDVAALASGTGVFLRFGTKLIGVTCEHVLAAFRSRRDMNPGTIFSFGRLVVDVEKHLIQADSSIDLATFDLSALSGRLDDEGRTVEPAVWPPGDVSPDDVIAFAGYPGLWREQPGLGGLRFYSFSSGASGVASLGSTHMYTRIEIDAMLRAGHGRLDLGPLGGLSGGPVFVWRRGIVVTAELVGFIQEYQESLDLLYIRRAHCIAADGTLVL
jgi:hypothetical protein